MTGEIQLLAPDDSTVLFDFAAPTGTGNPSTVITKLMTGLDLGTISQELNVFEGMLLGVKQSPVEVNLEFTASGTTYANLAAGLGQLGRYLAGARPWSPLSLKFTDGSVTRYLDIIGALNLPALLRGQPTAGLVVGRKNSVGAIPLQLLAQPWKRGALVTVGPTDVYNDPAQGALANVFPITVTGDLPTPVSLRANMNSGSAVGRVHIAHRAQGAEAAAIMADYLSDTGFAQCEATGRGWTVTLGTDTAGASDAAASPGAGTTVARTTYATVTKMSRRVRLTRTTKVDSLRGAWDVWARFKVSADSRHVVQLRWGVSTADPVQFSEPEVIHDVSGVPFYTYVEVKMGTIYVPQDVALGGVALELWSSRTSGTGNLDYDFVQLTPHDNQGTVVVPPGVSARTLGKDLTSPPDEITSDPTWVAGAVVGNSIQLNAVNEAAGWGPNAGTALAVGRHHFTFKWHWDGAGAKTLRIRVVCVTDNVVSAAEDIPFAINESRSLTLRFDAVAGKTYQPQIGYFAYAGSGKTTVRSITHYHMDSIISGHSLRTEPGDRYSVDRLDSSANLSGYLDIEGEIPALLQPGLNHVNVRADELAVPFYDETANVMVRVAAVTATYPPRYAL